MLSGSGFTDLLMAFAHLVGSGSSTSVIQPAPPTVPVV